MCHTITLRLWSDREWRVGMIEEKQQSKQIGLCEWNNNYYYRRSSSVRENTTRKDFSNQNLHWLPFRAIFDAVMSYCVVLSLGPWPWSCEMPTNASSIQLPFTPRHYVIHWLPLLFFQPVQSLENNVRCGILWESIHRARPRRRRRCFRILISIELSLLCPNTQRLTPALLTWCCYWVSIIIRRQW